MGELHHALIAEVSSSTDPSVWPTAFAALHPGAYALLLVSGPNPSRVALGLRRAGFVLRDTIMVFSGEPRLTASPCFIFRKPLEESTFVQQVLKTGTGAINIEACRVKHAGKADFEAHKAMVDAVKAKGGVRGDSWKNSSDLSGANDVSSAGRWPANALFVHSRSCKLVGETKVDAPVINRFTDGAKPFGNGAGHPFESIQTGDAEGKESVGVYECGEECPAQTLNDQSGISASSSSFRGERHGNIYGGGKGPSGPDTFRGHNDSGGASRFFSQFECDEGCPVPSLDEQSGNRRSAGNYPTSFSNGGGFTNGDLGHNCQGPLYNDQGGASRFFSQFEASPQLREWFVKLALPPGGKLLELRIG